MRIPRRPDRRYKNVTDITQYKVNFTRKTFAGLFINTRLNHTHRRHRCDKEATKEIRYFRVSNFFGSNDFFLKTTVTVVVVLILPTTRKVPSWHRRNHPMGLMGRVPRNF